MIGLVDAMIGTLPREFGSSYPLYLIHIRYRHRDVSLVLENT